MLRSSDGWDYESLKDRVLDRKANSIHNLKRIAAELKVKDKGMNFTFGFAKPKFNNNNDFGVIKINGCV